MPIDFLLEKESVTQHTLPTFAKEITIGVAFMHIARLQKVILEKIMQIINLVLTYSKI